MCKGEVLRFSCRHGLLMNLDTCAWPCPQLQVVNMKSVQPFKCYKCQHRLSTLSASSSTPSADASCASSFDSLESSTSISSMSSVSSAGSRPTSSTNRSANSVTTLKPHPAMVRNPTSISASCRKTNVTDRAFYFSCSTSAHYPSPHYAMLPYFIPHQDHACPPCQLASFRSRSMRETVEEARKMHPHLTQEMLVVDNRRQEVEIPTLEAYVQEKVKDERQFWWGRGRKWEEDLRRRNVLCKEEDGLGLSGVM